MAEIRDISISVKHTLFIFPPTNPPLLTICVSRFPNNQEILLDGELDPINLGGHVIMSRNNTHKNVGPKLLFHYKSAVPGAKVAIPYFKVI